MNRTVNGVFQELRKLGSENELTEGFHLLYNPWELLFEAKVAFLSLNPGRAPLGKEVELVCEPLGNSYKLERDSTKSPLTAQYLQLLELLELSPSEVLTAAYIPFRSNRWVDLTEPQKKSCLIFSRNFWAEYLKDKELVICCGSMVFDEVSRLVGCGIDNICVPSGWGRTQIKLAKFNSGKSRVVGLPHLSSYKLLSRLECRKILKSTLCFDSNKSL